MADPGPPPALEFAGVSFSYRGAPLLRDVDLRVHEGEFVAVVGGNGTGKTTLMKLGLGLLAPAAGTVRLFGEDVESFGDWAKVGYVPQRAVASSALPVSVEEVVTSGLAGGSTWFRRRRPGERERIDHVLELLGLLAVQRARMSELSGGQQQRALIARALVSSPRLLVMDEPTTGVDAEARGVLRSSLEHLVEVEGMAVVYVSHDPEGFAGLAQRVVDVGGGRAHARAGPAGGGAGSGG
ncbi:MAG TPA: metal ABC transporter ATP-binding protein [Acidimicrobiales bacterium]|nr:metal ABC transporter ATP-binding protein [Acidimicrobiales bacterium]